MRENETNTQTLESKSSTPSISEKSVIETIFFERTDKEFSDKNLKISGMFNATNRLLEVQMHFEKGAYLLLPKDIEDNEILLAKQTGNFDESPLYPNMWNKKQIFCNEDIPIEYRKYCHYDENKQTLFVKLSVTSDYALDYGSIPWCSCTFLHFMPDYKWYFLDRVNGG